MSRSGEPVHGCLTVFRACRCAVTVLIWLTVFGTNVLSFATANDNSDGESAAAIRQQPAFLRLQAFVDQHCIHCHDRDSDPAGQISLNSDSLALTASLLRDVKNVIDTHQMPPEGEEQPLDDQRTGVAGDLAILLQSISRQAQIKQTAIRRLNRFQYNNAVVDLFDLKCTVFTLPERAMREHRNYFRPETGRMPEVVHVGNRPLGKSQMIEPRLAGVAAFPQDLRAEHGYDNQADHLSLSPLLMESLLKLGHSITESKDFVPKTVGIWDEFFKTPNEQQDLRATLEKRLKPFLTKAFRRPVDQKTLDRYVAFVDSQLHRGTQFPQAMKLAAAAAISSPRFLYLYDSLPAESSFPDHSMPRESISSSDGASVSVDSFGLASRLSFFLWGTLPDSTLLDLAADGSLNESKVLLRQVDRMLTDKKLKRFCDSFPGQWLQLDRIVSSVPDRTAFPQFYFSKYRLSMHMQLEPLLLFETVLIENRPILELIDPDFSYRSKKLHAFYEPGDTAVTGKPTGGGVTVLQFQRVPLRDRRFGGVVTNAAVMTMTSGPDRTQPITRGAWMAAVIFNDPPKPPPADVPALEEKPAAHEQHLTLRERLAAHRERADCRGCHEKIDPLGFALENFDPIGRWRQSYDNGRDVDAAGSLFRRHSFSDVVELKDALRAEEDRFARAFISHLLSFALARQPGPVEELAIDEITQRCQSDHYRIKTIIREMVRHEIFRRRT